MWIGSDRASGRRLIVMSRSGVVANCHVLVAVTVAGGVASVHRVVRHTSAPVLLLQLEAAAGTAEL